MSSGCSCTSSIIRTKGTVAVSGSNLSITPTNPVTIKNEGRIEFMVTNSIPSGGVALPTVITVNGEAVPIYDKFGNVLVGYGIRPDVVMKGYFGNNGASATAHIQLINYPFIRCPK